VNLLLGGYAPLREAFFGGLGMHASKEFIPTLCYNYPVMQQRAALNRLKKRIRKNPALLHTVPAGEVPLEAVVFNCAQALVNSHGSVEDVHAVLRYLVAEAYTDAGAIPVIADALSRFGADSGFRGWLSGRQLTGMSESLAVRVLAMIRLFPSLGDGDYLCREFFLLMDRADLHLNPYNHAVQHTFSALIETIIEYAECPADNDDFGETFNLIEQEVRHKIEELEYKKLALPDDAERLQLFFENDMDRPEQWTAFLVEFLLRQKEVRQFLFAGLGIPVSYLIFFIALDERGHFSPLVRQAAMSALRNAPHATCLSEKFHSLRSDYFTIYPAAVPIVPDTTTAEFARSIGNALRLLHAGYDPHAVTEIAKVVLDTMPDSRAFLHEYPLAISAAPGDSVLSQQCFSLCFRTLNDTPDGALLRRYIEVADYSTPNSRGIPATLFCCKDLAMPFIRREYLSSLNIDNEAEIRLMSVPAAFTPPPFVRSSGVTKAKRLIETYMTLLELYTQAGDTFESQGGHSITREDIALLLEPHFDLSLVTAESFLQAKIMLWYVEPIHSIFTISEATEETLARINDYTETIYGKPLPLEEAREKARAVITAENEHIAAMNSSLDDDPELLWPLITEDSPLWTRLVDILVQRYTRRNTLTVWELNGVLYDMREKPSAPFYYPLTAAIGTFIQRTLSRAVRAFEEDHHSFKKVRERLYDYYFKQLDKAERALDPCGWQEGKCLRLDRQCCTIPYRCQHLTETSCRFKALTCKFWLCSAARARLASTRKGRTLLAKRRRYSFWCQALNIPLKIRCTRLNSFDDKATEPYADVSRADWFDRPLKG
jgi:hypothetical protein